MSELEKMLSEKVYNCLDYELANLRETSAEIMLQFNCETELPKRLQLLDSIGLVAEQSSYIVPPFEVSYGCHITIGHNSYINSGALFLDNSYITIGDNVMVGPRVQIYTAAHSLNAEERIAGNEIARPITIKDKVWIGGGAIILPGITIGEGAVVGAGSVVTKDVKPYTIVAGNPARLIRQQE